MTRWFLFFLFLPTAAAQPALLVKNAAFPGYSSQSVRIAARSLIQVRPGDPLAGFLLGTFQPPEALNPTLPLTLTIQPAKSEPLPVDVLSVSFSDILAVVPPAVPVGMATLTLTRNDGIELSEPVEIVAASFSLFTNGSGTGPALAQNVNPGLPIELNALTRPARPGGYVTLWGTGLGHTAQQDVVASLGGRAVPVQFAGPSPTIEGLDQINILVPFDADITDGCYVSVRIEVLGEPANTVTISKAGDPGPCAHPLGLSEPQMERLDEGGSLPTARIGFYSTTGPQNALGPFPGEGSGLVRAEHVDASFLFLEADGVAWMSRQLDVPDSGCRVSRRSLFGVGFIRSSGGFNVGESVGVSGPQGGLLDVPRRSPEIGFYSHLFGPTEPVDDPANLPPFYVGAGDWEFSAPGSSEVEPFRVPVRLPPPLEVTNFQELKSVERMAGVTVTWKAEGYLPSDTMSVNLLGWEGAGNDSALLDRPLSLTCNVPVLAGQLIIDPELLGEFAATAPELPTSLTLSVIGPPGEASRFTFRLTSGESVPGVVTYGRAVTFPIGLN